MAGNFADTFDGESADTHITSHVTTTGGYGWVEKHLVDIYIDDSSISGSVPDIASYTGDGVGLDFPYVLIDEDMDDEAYEIECDLIMNQVTTVNKIVGIVARGATIDGKFILGGLRGEANGVRKLVLMEGTTERGSYQFDFATNVYYRVKLVCVQGSGTNEVDCEVFLDTGSGYVSRITATITDSDLYGRAGRVGLYGVLPNASIIGWNDLEVTLLDQTLSIPSPIELLGSFNPTVLLDQPLQIPTAVELFGYFVPTVVPEQLIVLGSPSELLDYYVPTVNQNLGVSITTTEELLSSYNPAIIGSNALSLPEAIELLTAYAPIVVPELTLSVSSAIELLTVYNPSVNIIAELILTTTPELLSAYAPTLIQEPSLVFTLIPELLTSYNPTVVGEQELIFTTVPELLTAYTPSVNVIQELIFSTTPELLTAYNPTVLRSGWNRFPYNTTDNWNRKTYNSSSSFSRKTFNTSSVWTRKDYNT